MPRKNQPNRQKNAPTKELVFNIPASVVQEAKEKAAKKFSKKKPIPNPAVLLSMGDGALRKAFGALGIKLSTDYADVAHVENLLAIKNATVQDKNQAKTALDSSTFILKSIERHTRILRRVGRSQTGVERVEELLSACVQKLSEATAA